MDWIILDRFVVDCIVGILEAEQRTLQPLELELRMGIDLQHAGETGDLASSVDYSATMEHITFLTQQGRFRLLESLGLAACRLALAAPVKGEPRAQVQRADIRIRKPNALGGSAHPNVQMTRDTATGRCEILSLDNGVEADILVQTSLTGAYRLRIPSGASFDVPAGMVLMPIFGEIASKSNLDGQERIARGTDAIVQNVGKGTACVLAVSHPPVRANGQ